MINKDKNRLIIGISGASGIIYGIRLLELLRTIPDELRPETHLIISKSGEVTLAYETKLKVATVHKLADVIHANKDIGASLASGSFKTMGMIIAPCSVKTLAEIATGVTDTLISRAADVILKERRRLVCMVRETPVTCRTPEEYAIIDRDGSHHCSACSCFLCKASIFGRYD